MLHVSSMVTNKQEANMFRILADVFTRATFQDFPRSELPTEMRGDWRPPVHWQHCEPDTHRRKGWRGENR
jgi:hypothetical protein